jgi:serine/threonine-protein kinase
VGRTGSGIDEPQLWVRALDQLEGVQLAGIVGNLSGSPFTSPDGQWIAYVWGGELRKVSVSGGPPISLCRVPGAGNGFRGGSWGADDRIIFASNDPSRGLFSVSAGGGDTTVLTKPDPAHGEGGHVFPWILPGGRAVLFTIVPIGSIETAVIAVLDLKSGQRKVLVRGGTAPQYIDSGHLLYASAGSLRAVRFDPTRLEVLSDPVPVVDSVLTKSSGAAEFSVSRDGTLVYIAGNSLPSAQRSLVWVNRQGHEDALSAPPRAYNFPRLSPDGTRVALDVRDQENDIWIWDLAHENPRRLTSDPALDVYPVWTRDSRQIIFTSTRAGAADLYRQSADGTGVVQPLPKSSAGLDLTSIAADGTRGVGFSAGTSPNIVILALGERPRIDPLIATKGITRNPEIAPNGRWLAYESNESGRFQISVRPFPNVDGGWWQVSTQGGTKPLWAPSGRELFYIDDDGYLTMVPVQTVDTFAFDKPSRLLQTRYFSGPVGRTYDVSSDGQRFLMIKDAAGGSAPPPSMVVVLNWLDELKARLPTR